MRRFLTALLFVGLISNALAVGVPFGFWKSGVVVPVLADSNTATTSTQELPGLTSVFNYVAGSFVAGSSYTCTQIDLPVYKTGTPTQNVVVSIYTDNAGVPGTLVGTGSSPLASSSLGTSSAYVSFTGLSAALTNGTTYWIVFDGHLLPGDAVSYVLWDASNGAISTQRSSNGTLWLLYDASTAVKFKTYK